MKKVKAKTKMTQKKIANPDVVCCFLLVNGVCGTLAKESK